MLLWAILLQTVPLKQEDDRPQPALPRILDLAQQQRSGEATGRRYRLDVATVSAEDNKHLALRGQWKPCGTTGAPVCPSKGRILFRTGM